MRRVLSISLLIVSPLCASQHLIKLLVQRAPVISAGAFAPASSRFLASSALMHAGQNDSAVKNEQFKKTMDLILVDMKSAGFLDYSPTSLSLTRVGHVELRCCDTPFPLVAADIKLQRILHWINNVADQVPTEWQQAEQRERYDIAKSAVKSVLLEIKQDKRWLGQYETYRRGLKAGIFSSLH